MRKIVMLVVAAMAVAFMLAAAAPLMQEPLLAQSAARMRSSPSRQFQRRNLPAQL